MMLQGVAVNTEIPVWGVLLALGGFVAAFAALRTQMTTHEAQDDKRFDETNEMLQEIRADIKTVLQRHH
jgi:hypothetical protein